MSNIILELTDAGKEHMRELMEGEEKKLIVTRIVTTAECAPDGKRPTEQEMIETPMQTILPTHFRSRDGGLRGVIDAELTNEGIDTSYEIRQIGIYAARHPVAEDGTDLIYNDEDDFLFRVAQFENPTRVPARHERHWVFKPSFTFVVQNTQRVEVRLDPRTHNIHKLRTILIDDVGVHGLNMLPVRSGSRLRVLHARDITDQDLTWCRFIARNDGYLYIEEAANSSS